MNTNNNNKTEIPSTYAWKGVLCTEDCEKNDICEALLNQLYGYHTAKAMKFLLEHVDEATMKAFFNVYVKPEKLSIDARAKIIVRRTEKKIRQTGNTGHFQIYVIMGDGQQQLLRFTNQASTVYYLMYLIDRHQKQGVLPPLNLGSNRQTFVALYHMVYDNITHDKIVSRYERLLRRSEGNIIRVGRQNEIIHDIRKHLNTIFDDYGESFLPYAMTAHSHLSVPADHIVFEGDALELLKLRCA